MSGLSNGSSRRSHLGRGLAALIPDDVMSPGAPSRVPDGGPREVALTDITPNPEQPRHLFNEEALKELTSSIREHGIMTPLVVRSVGGGRYILIAGERRLRAAGLAGLKQVPVVIRKDAENPAIQLELAMVENLQRADLNPLESARGYARLSEEYGYTQEEIARKVGKQRPTIANALRLLGLSSYAQSAIENGHISAGHGRALLAFNDESMVKKTIADIKTKGLSVRAVEELAKNQDKTRRVAQTVRQKEKVLHYANELLTRSLATKVAIKPRQAGGGRIVIDYHSNEDLERLIQRLRGEE